MFIAYLTQGLLPAKGSLPDLGCSLIPVVRLLSGDLALAPA
jgi:hypothetical protein